MVHTRSASDYLYASSWWKLGVFKRDRISGELSPLQTVEIGETPSSNITYNCIILSHDNKFLYSAIRQNLYIFKIDLATGFLTQVDIIKNLNSDSNISFDISCEISRDDKFLYITGGHGVSVYRRDLTSGKLEFQQILLGNNFENHGLTYAEETKVSMNNKYLYTLTLSMGSGAINVLNRDTVTGFLKLEQTYFFDYWKSNFVNPRSLTMSPNNKALGVNSENKMALFGIDETQGKIKFIRTYTSSTDFNCSMGGRKVFDFKNRFLYTCPAFNDSIFSYKLNVFLENDPTICPSDVLTLSPFSEYKSFQWSNGSINSEIKVNSEGTYKIDVTDIFNVSHSDSVTVKWPEISLGNDTFLYRNQSLQISPGFNYKSYQWNNSNLGNFYYFLKNDSTIQKDTLITISVVAEDYNGCFNSDTIKVQLFALNNNAKIFNCEHIAIFPNPTDSYICIEGIENKDEKIRIDVYSVNGLHVMQRILNSDEKIDVTSLPKGVYLLSLGFSDGLILKKFIKN